MDYTPLAAVTEARAALEPGAPLLWEHVPGNLCADYEAGDAAAVDAAFAAAARIVSVDVVNNRVTAAALEPRGAIGTYDRESGRFTLVASTQNVHVNRDQIAAHVLRIPPAKLRVVAHDVGGGFGMRNNVYPEYALVLWAARRLGRPVKWVAERGEGFLSDAHGRDQVSHARLALAADGRFLALRVETVGNAGAYAGGMGPYVPAYGTARLQGGPYRIAATHYRARVAFTNTVPIEPYRGAGQPESAYQIERAVETAAAELGIDPVELRRRNLIGPTDMPYTNGHGTVIDTGDFPAVMDKALALADRDGFAGRRAAARTRGLRRGMGVCPYVRVSGGAATEHAALRFAANGAVTIAVGSQSTGTGHATVFAQIVAERLGVRFADIGYAEADTDLTPLGGGHGGSRSLETAGVAICIATDRVIDKGCLIAAHLLEAAAADIAFSAGRFTIAGTDRGVGINEVIAASFDPARLPDGMEPGLDAALDHSREALTHPNGCHVAEVEVDPETGRVRIVGYAIVNDFGTVINPLLTAGQVMGATVQGIGQALLEEVVFDAASGQVLTGSFMDYCLPRAVHVPDFRMAFHAGAPTQRNPLGVKGAGEDGCVGAPPAVVHAVLDALAEDGVRDIAMPLTAERVWRAIPRRPRQRGSGRPRVVAVAFEPLPARAGPAHGLQVEAAAPIKGQPLGLEQPALARFSAAAAAPADLAAAVDHPLPGDFAARGHGGHGVADDAGAAPGHPPHLAVARHLAGGDAAHQGIDTLQARVRHRRPSGLRQRQMDANM